MTLVAVALQRAIYISASHPHVRTHASYRRSNTEARISRIFVRTPICSNSESFENRGSTVLGNFKNFTNEEILNHGDIYLNMLEAEKKQLSRILLWQWGYSREGVLTRVLCSRLFPTGIPRRRGCLDMLNKIATYGRVGHMIPCSLLRIFCWGGDQPTQSKMDDWTNVDKSWK